MPPVTLKDVALHAGVSYQTVSNVLNGHPHIRPATKERVLASIAALDYHPNHAAKAFREARTTTLCCAFYGHNPDEVNDPYRNLVQSAFIAEAQAHSYSVTTAFIGQDGDLSPLRQRFLQRHFGGVVIVGTTLMLPQWQTIQQWMLPAVLFDHSLPGALTVSADYPAGMAALVQHHVSTGRRRLALIMPQGDPGSTSVGRREGFKAACAAAGVEGWMVDGDWSYESGYRAMQALWASNRRPDAVLGGNDRMGAGALRAAHDLGVGVPDEVSISGFDDFEFAQFTTPSLTTIQIPHGDMARYAVRTVIGLLKDGSPTSRVFLGSLMVRESA
ncbi:LacI family transcriptional regulator [Deinococcus sp. KSM4-11]|uniref:LacI family DNA-binding transcriptional regulator n=1 Tax=Deinococcus sp. KSM4-11 TaxID=2568654 RepID=UPI0010A2C1F8|nr:LacI family DNA-binding transcriptional regulator [Deinococcus sp. KSM4-11]THF84384.1 LacI family transcriptional regulator [Deinococcus sp. KSM4-11]